MAGHGQELSLKNELSATDFDKCHLPSFTSIQLVIGKYTWNDYGCLKLTFKWHAWMLVSSMWSFLSFKLNLEKLVLSVNTRGCAYVRHPFKLFSYPLTVCSKEALRSMVIFQLLLRTTEIAVIHHTDCGMLTFTMEETTLASFGGAFNHFRKTWTIA